MRCAVDAFVVFVLHHRQEPVRTLDVQRLCRLVDPRSGAHSADVALQSRGDAFVYGGRALHAVWALSSDGTLERWDFMPVPPPATLASKPAAAPAAAEASAPAAPSSSSSSAAAPAAVVESKELKLSDSNSCWAAAAALLAEPVVDCVATHPAPLAAEFDTVGRLLDAAAAVALKVGELLAPNVVLGLSSACLIV